ncbi:TPM domain-containing protein [Spirabiliibacterium falconis]|uniref:TPM domain-containing protein n=1 Tax=Spirabiliibacterium falconis TaxID=572023 RepID=UPI001AADC14E|nr:TPM domain-containing protein [Spirabiliibacterium falconis]MBE2894086.1 methanol dehydrogenase [Spirabiliibacterium falconis]
MKLWHRTLFIFFTFVACVAHAAYDFPSVPKPFRYVNDYTHTLTSTQMQTLESYLQDYSHKTSSQITVVMLPSVGNNDISEYAFALGDYWGVGRKNLDNGVLMLIAKNDRKIFIATGRGLEGALPDALLSQLIRHEITPQFKQGNYFQGIANGLQAIMNASVGEYAPQQAQEDDNTVGWIIGLAVQLFIFFVFIQILRGHRSVYVSPSNVENALRRSRSRHDRGGFGGGFGGFGGGGAGGSW